MFHWPLAILKKLLCNESTFSNYGTSTAEIKMPILKSTIEAMIYTEKKITRKTSAASSSTHSIKTAWAFSTVLGLPVKHFATIASQVSFANL